MIWIINSHDLLLWYSQTWYQLSPSTSNNADQDEDLDEFDLYPGTLELPQMRSPR